MISTKDPNQLPDRITLERIAKAISVLDAIICQDWQYRYYSFNSNWDENEQVLQMRNGEGDEMHILFRNDGCTINGFACEYEQENISNLTYNLPEIFHEFTFGEPIKSIGTTFCLWTIENKNWQVGIIKNHENNSEKMLNVFNGNPQTYCNWAKEYFDKENISIDTVQKIYNGEILTKEMVLIINNELDDWQQLEEDLAEINYPYNF